MKQNEKPDKEMAPERYYVSPADYDFSSHRNRRPNRDPNYCPVCTPKGLGYCRCDIACNE